MFGKALKAGQKSAELAQASLLHMKLYVSFLQFRYLLVVNESHVLLLFSTEAGVMVNPHAESINSEISGKQQQQPLGPEATATTTTTALQVPETAMAEDHSAEDVVMHASGEPNGELVA